MTAVVEPVGSVQGGSAGLGMDERPGLQPGRTLEETDSAARHHSHEQKKIIMTLSHPKTQLSVVFSFEKYLVPDHGPIFDFSYIVCIKIKHVVAKIRVQAISCFGLKYLEVQDFLEYCSFSEGLSLVEDRDFANLPFYSWVC